MRTSDVAPGWMTLAVNTIRGWHPGGLGKTGWMSQPPNRGHINGPAPHSASSVPSCRGRRRCRHQERPRQETSRRTGARAHGGFFLAVHRGNVRLLQRGPSLSHQTVVLTVEVSQSREPAVAPTVVVTHLKPHFVATQWRCWAVLPNSTVPVPTGS